MSDIDKDIERCKELQSTIYEGGDYIYLNKNDKQAIENILSEFQGVRNIATSTLIDNANLQSELEIYKKIAERIKERKKWLEDNILDNDYASDNDKDRAEYQVDILEEILDWARKEGEKK